eukprot:Lithocolla_globosa_v1_NODE_2717_length_1894_cov_17.901577.p1 type:complete len:447 gc:universal NODE_2717_length_1894_cov_17.901577:1431-91(-)
MQSSSSRLQNESHLNYKENRSDRYLLLCILQQMQRWLLVPTTKKKLSFFFFLSRRSRELRRIEMWKLRGVVPPNLHVVNESVRRSLSTFYSSFQRDILKNELKGKLFSLSEEKMSDIARAGFKLDPQLENSFKTFERKELLLRKPVPDMLNSLLSYGSLEKKSKKMPVMMINGTQGSGKTCALLQVAEHLLHQNWLVVYIPKVSEWMIGQHTYSKSHRLADGTVMWNQPSLSLKLLNHIFAMNQNVLTTIPLKNSYTIQKEEVLKEKSSLLELVQLGQKSPLHSTEAIISFFEELNHVTESPVLLAIDQVNRLFGTSKYWHPNFRNGPIHIHHFILARLVIGYLTGVSRLSRGGVVVAPTSGNYTSRNMQHLLEQDFLQVTHSFETPTLSVEDIETLLSYYNEYCHQFFHQGRQQAEYMRAMSSGLPKQLNTLLLNGVHVKECYTL